MRKSLSIYHARNSMCVFRFNSYTKSTQRLLSQQASFFKITNAEECHKGFQYKTGFNRLNTPFNYNGSCESGGLYFSNSKNICKYLDWGIYLRQITLPKNDPDFKIIPDNFGDKFGANILIFGDKYDLKNVETFETMKNLGINLRVADDKALRWASEKGHLSIVKFLIDNGADIHVLDNEPVRLAAEHGHIEIVEFLVNLGANVKADNNYAIRFASERGHLSVVDFLIKHGANVKADNNYAFIYACKNGHLDVAKMLKNAGANPKANNDLAIKMACIGGKLSVVKYLVDLDLNIRADNDYCMEVAARNGHYETVKYLHGLGAYYNSAIKLAQHYNHQEIVDYLQKEICLHNE
ncbi:ankyrin repeat protein [Cotonvirus japonicus]|uniref:Ankyrin repeat protein n=1 Tax=Cotonvirus japonicus TaxID=2811091 RepID=A0ABM7NRD7_9VIRU|nr:ankyrin repeat protein [Cotonvirus japonicus]BCS82725.1 ankyrin repeat protein [Cotonvirus japonicus]